MGLGGREISLYRIRGKKEMGSLPEGEMLSFARIPALCYNTK